jgi:hypothetical protein
MIGFQKIKHGSKNIDEYYNTRKNFKYYKTVNTCLSTIDFSSIIDVGSRKSPVLESIDNSVYKTRLDIVALPPMPNIHDVTADFYTWVPDRIYDVAICLQVLEHLDDPSTFVKKLFNTAKTVIVSVPYKWKPGTCKEHIQDPVDEKKLLSWTDREPNETYIIVDRLSRLICLYKN